MVVQWSSHPPDISEDGDLNPGSDSLMWSLFAPSKFQFEWLLVQTYPVIVWHLSLKVSW